MGRFFFTILILYLFLSAPVKAQTVSRQVTVTAAVLPSSQWIALLQNHSYVSSAHLPPSPSTLYTVSLSDGIQPQKDREVKMLILHNNMLYSQTSKTNSSGLARFIIPDEYLNNSVVTFNCKIINREIAINYIYQ